MGRKSSRKYSNCYDSYFNSYGTLIFGDLVDWSWFKAQAIAESALDPDALSVAGAIGVMQLMPPTAEWMAKKLRIDCLPLVPHINIQLGIGYGLHCWSIWKKEHGLERSRFMLGSYNAGPGNIIRAQKLAQSWSMPPDEWGSIVHALPQITGNFAKETIVYVGRVEKYFLQLREEKNGHTQR